MTKVKGKMKRKMKRVKQKKAKNQGINIKAAGVIDLGMEEWEADQNTTSYRENQPVKRKLESEKHSSPVKKSKLDRIDERKEKAFGVKEEFKSSVAGLKEDGLPDMSAWKQLFVPDNVLRSLAEDGFVTPTPIQALALPSAIRDRMDIVGAAQTGSGKTLAFGIPLIHNILQFKENRASEEDKDSASEDSSLEADSDDGEGINEADAENDSESISESEEDATETSDTSKSLATSDTESSDGEEVEQPSSQIVQGQMVEELEVPFGVEFGEGSGDEEGSVEEECDMSPGEEEEDIEEPKEGELGCVKAVNNVVFDWLEKPKQRKRKAQKGSPLLALVLCPTRELAIQVTRHIEKAARYTGIKIATVVGGMSSQKQERLLKKHPEIVVATPGRLWELIQQGESHLNTVEYVRYLVIDEADRMVEKGHFQELTKLLELINSDESRRKKRQTFVFSATLTMVHSGPDRFIFKKKKKFQKMDGTQKLDSLMLAVGLKDRPKVIDLSRKEGTADTLVESRIMCEKKDKDLYLYYFTQQYPGRTLVFANSKDCLRRLVSLFTLLQCCPLPLHADMHQRQRLKNLDRFKADSRGLLLATDVAARGLDIPDVQHVIHYQVPRTTENYVHRSGRTARASKEGLSVMLVGPEDSQNYRKIVRTLNRDEDLPGFPVEHDFLKGVKERVILATNIDKQEHHQLKQKRQNSWFEKAAKEVEIELDEDQLLHDIGDSVQQAKQKTRFKQMKQDLGSLLRQPLVGKQFSGRYPTKSGKLVVPRDKEFGQSNAASVLKLDVEKMRERGIKAKPCSTNRVTKTKCRSIKRDKKDKPRSTNKDTKENHRSTKRGTKDKHRHRNKDSKGKSKKLKKKQKPTKNKQFTGAKR